MSIAAGTIIWLMIGLGARPLLVNQSGLSQAVYDHEGHLLRLTLSSDEKYRLWVPLAEIPPAMIEATLAQEDAWFRWHPGVNPFSLARATFTTYLGRGRRVGGSTIAMQLVRLRFGINSRTVTGKIEQILQAIRIGRFYTRDEILEAYLNAAPYGGNIEGVGAASMVYFGKQPRYLSVAQAQTLAVIPQNPRLRNPRAAGGQVALARARTRLATAFLRTHRRAESADFIPNLAVTIASRSALPFGAPHLVNRVLAENQRAPRIVTTLDAGLQELLERQLRMFTERNGRLGINNGAVILVDYRTMQVKGYVGSADYFSDSINGQVNGLRARRSPGSALKPFIYALAIDQGLIHPRTMLKDTAIRISAYNPENFDRDFLGPIDATSALVRSRNVPAIEVANMLAPPGLYGFLKRAGVRNLRPAGFYGLALALGGVEVSMEEMAGLYAMLASGGVLRPLVSTTTPPPRDSRSVRLLSPEASYVVLQMLRDNPRPLGDFSLSQVPAIAPVPWKTGTSYGYRDAWALWIAGPFVLGVWIGNFDGTPNANFVGRDAAGALFFEIVDALRARGPLIESIVQGPLNLKKIKVCALSGQLPGPYCDHFKDTWFIPGKSPITTCQIHREVAIDVRSHLRACPGRAGASVNRIYEFWPSDLLKLFRAAGVARRPPPPTDPACTKVTSGGAAPLISSPGRGVRYSAPAGGRTEISFTAVTDADSATIYWFIDDQLAGTSRPGESFFWKAKPGTFLVRAVDEQGRAAAQELSVVP
ncbi:MAG TPA: penicillin-binding protein 1C [Candidatus Binataceae bacterium]